MAEAAALIGVTTQMVRVLIRAGKLPGWTKISTANNAPFTGPLSAVEAYLEQQLNTKRKSG